MTIDEATAIFSSYSLAEQREFLAWLAFELTIVARDSYEVGGDGLTDARRVRRINEVQHRVTSFLSALLRNDLRRYPEDVLINIILNHPDDTTLEWQVREAFARVAMRQHVPAA
jgi:hypothetical protein